MSFGGKTNPKSLRGGISGTNMPEWMTYVGLQYVPTKVTYATGQPSANPKGSLYIGNNIQVSGASDGNIVLSLGIPSDGSPIGTYSTTLSGKTNVISITGTLNNNLTPGTGSVGIGATHVASGQNSIAIGAQSSASANNTIAIGNTTTTTNTNGIAIGVGSAAGGVTIGNSSTTAGTGSVAIGPSITVGASGAVVVSSTGTIGTGTGYGNTICGAGNAGMNTNNNAYMTYLGANAAINQAPAGVHGSVAVGTYGGVDQAGAFTFSEGGFTTANQASITTLIGRMRTTDATATEIGFPGAQAECQSSLAPTGRIILNNNSSYIFDCDIAARVSPTGTDYSFWNIKFCITREAAAANTALVGTPTITVLGQTAGATAWTVAVTADTTNGRPAIALTGAAATTIRWAMSARVTKVVG